MSCVYGVYVSWQLCSHYRLEYRLEYRYFVHTLYIHCIYMCISVHTKYIHCTYWSISVHKWYILGSYKSISFLSISPAENKVGRVPLIPLFLAGNPTPTIPHVYSKRKESGFPLGCTDAAALDERRGSDVYEVNPWLWQFGRGKPRLGGLTVEETADRQLAKDVDRKKRAVETRRRRKADPAWWKIEVCLVHVCTSYVKYRSSMYWVHAQYKPSI